MCYNEDIKLIFNIFKLFTFQIEYCLNRQDVKKTPADLLDWSPTSPDIHVNDTHKYPPESRHRREIYYNTLYSIFQEDCRKNSNFREPRILAHSIGAYFDCWSFIIFSPLFKVFGFLNLFSKIEYCLNRQDVKKAPADLLDWSPTSPDIHVLRTHKKQPESRHRREIYYNTLYSIFQEVCRKNSNFRETWLLAHGIGTYFDCWSFIIFSPHFKVFGFLNLFKKCFKPPEAFIAAGGRNLRFVLYKIGVLCLRTCPDFFVFSVSNKSFKR